MYVSLVSGWAGGGGSSGRPRRVVSAGWWGGGWSGGRGACGNYGSGHARPFYYFFSLLHFFLRVSHSAIIIVVISRRHRGALAFLSGSHRSGREREQRVWIMVAARYNIIITMYNRRNGRTSESLDLRCDTHLYYNNIKYLHNILYIVRDRICSSII